jgi:hypothetical protein
MRVLLFYFSYRASISHLTAVAKTQVCQFSAQLCHEKLTFTAFSICTVLSSSEQFSISDNRLLNT